MEWEFKIKTVKQNLSLSFLIKIPTFWVNMLSRMAQHKSSKHSESLQKISSLIIRYVSPLFIPQHWHKPCLQLHFNEALQLLFEWGHLITVSININKSSLWKVSRVFSIATLITEVNKDIWLSWHPIVNPSYSCKYSLVWQPASWYSFQSLCCKSVKWQFQCSHTLKIFIATSNS